MNYESSKKTIYVKDASDVRFIKNILIVDDAIDTTWCDHLIKKFNDASDAHYDARVPSIDGTEREAIHLTKLFVADQDTTWMHEKLEISRLMMDAYFMYKTNIKFPILLTGLPETEYLIELPTIKKYVKNSADMIGPHSDTYMRGWEDTHTVKAYVGNRFMNILFYLNDVEEGGETEFYFDDCTIIVPPKKGRLVVFPPLWTHIHAGMTPISDDKYICNGYLRAAVTEETFNSRGSYR